MTQEQAFEIFTMGHNILLTGAAGSGKTYLVNMCIRYCQEHDISVAVTASTGIAATHIGGMTIHSWSGMGIRDTLSDSDIDTIIGREYIAKRFGKTKVLIIDEISMLGGDFLDNLDRLLRSARFSLEPFGGMQIVLVGDFFQLPPVSRGGDAVYAFEHPSWRTYRLAVCKLSTQYRQVGTKSQVESQNEEVHAGGENALLKILNEIRAGSISTQSMQVLRSRNIPVDTTDHTELFTKNISVDTYNTKRLDQIHADTMIYTMQSKGSAALVDSIKKGCLAPETLVLKIGARVMFVKNNAESGYVNGSIGHVTGISDGQPVVELLDGTRIVAETMDWTIEEDGKRKASLTQVPLRLAWAITVHKSQGMTLDTAVMDLSDAFVPGQGYVALSRVRTLDGLILRGFNETALHIDERVHTYDDILDATTTRVVERLGTLPLQDIRTKKEETIHRHGGRLEAREIRTKDDKKPKTSTHMETYEYMQTGMCLVDIATTRELKLSTIYSHIERLIEEGREMNVDAWGMDDIEYISDIRSAFLAVGTYQLTPVLQYLEEHIPGGTYTYDDIRYVRILLKSEGVVLE